MHPKIDSNTATVFANNTMDGLSIVGIDIYVGRRGLHILASKRFLDELNGIPLLDHERVRSEIFRKFRIPKDNISFR